MAAIRASARRRTQASNRVVNIAHLGVPYFLSGCADCLLVSLDHLRRDSFPRVPLGLFVPIGADAAAPLGIPGQDDQCGTEFGPPLGADGQTVAPWLEDRHVAWDLGGDHRNSRSHRLQE